MKGTKFQLTSFIILRTSTTVLLIKTTCKTKWWKIKEESNLTPNKWWQHPHQKVSCFLHALTNYNFTIATLLLPSSPSSSLSPSSSSKSSPLAMSPIEVWWLPFSPPWCRNITDIYAKNICNDEMNNWQKIYMAKLYYNSSQSLSSMRQKYIKI